MAASHESISPELVFPKSKYPMFTMKLNDDELILVEKIMLLINSSELLTSKQLDKIHYEIESFIKNKQWPKTPYIPNGNQNAGFNF